MIQLLFSVGFSKINIFLQGDFLHAKLGSNPNFTWKNLLQAQELLQLGVRWQTGDVVDIKVRGDPWLGRDDNFFVKISLEELNVSSLLSHDGTWNASLINELLQPSDMEVAVRTPLSLLHCEDKRIWHFDRYIKYTMKSGYHIIFCHLYRFPLSSMSPVQKHTWKLKVPPKVKAFLWRGLWGILPPKVNLR